MFSSFLFTGNWVLEKGEVIFKDQLLALSEVACVTVNKFSASQFSNSFNFCPKKKSKMKQMSNKTPIDRK